MSALGLPPEMRACLFDMDGVLTQTAKIHATAWKELFDDYLRERSRHTGEAFEPFALSDYTRHLDGKLRIDGARSFLESRGIELNESEVDALARRKDDRVVELLHTRGVDTYADSVRFVKAVREAGLRTAVVSASKHCQEVLASAGIESLFDARVDGVVAEEQHLAGKPAPDTFLAAARAIDVDPPEAAVFEDALAGIDAGRAGHFGFVVGVDRIGRANELRRHGADIVVADLGELIEEP